MEIWKKLQAIEEIWTHNSLYSGRMLKPLSHHHHYWELCCEQGSPLASIVIHITNEISKFIVFSACQIWDNFEVSYISGIYVKYQVEINVL